MLSKLLRGFSRLLLHVLKVVLVPVELVNPRRYMKFYTWMLARYGVSFTGVPRYISSRVRFDDFGLVTIGERTVLSSYVILLTHDYSVTTALTALGEPPSSDIAIRSPIVIGNNVFVGMGAILLPGALIGDNVIIGAGSVVRGVVEPDSIIIGNPAVKVGGLTDNPERWRARSVAKNASADDE